MTFDPDSEFGQELMTAVVLLGYMQEKGWVDGGGFSANKERTIANLKKPLVADKETAARRLVELMNVAGRPQMREEEIEPVFSLAKRAYDEVFESLV